MIETFDKWDKKILLIINEYHNSVWDYTMDLFTGRFFWIPFYALLLFFIIKVFKKQAILVLLAITLLIAATDQLSSSVIKPLAKRNRPCHEYTDLHLPSGCGGKYGFVSSHASNTFALATFLFLLFGRQPVWSLMFFWAFAVSYSRVYLGAHYPGDIFFGALIGILFAILFFRLYRNTLKHLGRKGIFSQKT